MIELYRSSGDYYALLMVLGIVMAALGGFVMGFIMADNRRKADDAFCPKHRPDDYAPMGSQSAKAAASSSNR